MPRFDDLDIDEVYDLFNRPETPKNQRSAEALSRQIDADILGALVVRPTQLRAFTATQPPRIVVRVPNGAPIGRLIAEEGITGKRFMQSLAWKNGDPTAPIMLIFTDLGGDEEGGERYNLAIELDPTIDRHFLIDVAAAGEYRLDVQTEYGTASFGDLMNARDLLGLLADVLVTRRWAAAA